ncbi:MAG: arsenite S-adenosylmethyltransferase [Anaerolineaceae bacterium]|nr:arsenite S-adenosylmethyltransferase [Anaerolineaceae bacterium]
MDTNEKIHENVRDRYAAIASQFDGERAASCCEPNSTVGIDQIGTEATAACCGPQTELTATHAAQLYGDVASDLPFDVTGLSLGCGDPVTVATLQQGEVVLDLGSGGGIDCFYAAKQVGDDGHVIGVDMTDEMLAKANVNKEKLGMTNVEFRKGNIEDMPVDSNSVDVIMSNCVINLSPRKAEVFSEAFRVLKPGGRVSISDIVTQGEFTPEQRADAEDWAACISGAIDVDEYIGLMEQAGFVKIQVIDKVAAEERGVTVDRGDMPRIYSARITAYKPTLDSNNEACCDTGCCN